MFRSSVAEQNSFMVLHYAPSILAHTHNLTAVLFPECEDPLVERPDNKPECMFAPSRMAKVRALMSPSLSYLSSEKKCGKFHT